MELITTPLAGYIHALSWQRPPGNGDFKVTRDAAGHVAAGGPPANDYGDANATDLDPVLAPHAGVVAQALTIGSANLSIDWTDAAGLGWRAVMAHDALPHPVKVGQPVVAGQPVGRVGATGADAQHLHLQLGYRHWLGWTWVDPWPHLEQNHNLQVNASATVNLRAAPGLGGAIVGQASPLGTVVQGQRVAGPGAILLRRAVASVRQDGYEWLPFSLPGVGIPLWIARPFTHFV